MAVLAWIKWGDETLCSWGTDRSVTIGKCSTFAVDFGRDFTVVEISEARLERSTGLNIYKPTFIISIFLIKSMRIFFYSNVISNFIARGSSVYMFKISLFPIEIETRNFFVNFAASFIGTDGDGDPGTSHLSN